MILKIEEIQVSKSQEDIQQKIKEIKEKYPNKVFDLESAQYFNKIEDIGTGAKYKYTKVSMNKFYTFKEIKNGNLNSENIQQLIDEFNIMIELKHQNILKTHCLYYDLKKNQVSILLDYYPINLEQAIKNKMVSRTQHISSICQIAKAMKYINSYKIKHLNLKPSNICFSKYDGTILIGDFHIAQRYISDDQKEQKEDIYAFGSILYFIITEGKMPRNKCAPIGYPIFLSELIEVYLSNEFVLKKYWNMKISTMIGRYKIQKIKLKSFE